MQPVMQRSRGGGVAFAAGVYAAGAGYGVVDIATTPGSSLHGGGMVQGFKNYLTSLYQQYNGMADGAAAALSDE